MAGTHAGGKLPLAQASVLSSVTDSLTDLDGEAGRHTANPSFGEIWEAARGLQEPVIAIEALWDGESAGWLVDLLAVVERPSQTHAKFGERRLAILRDPQGDMRLFNGQVPPWSEAGLATEYGQQLAERLGVPFHFASRNQPDLDAPRWWDTVSCRPPLKSADPGGYP